MVFLLTASPVFAQLPEDNAADAPTPDVTREVNIAPLAADEEIARRLNRILEATEWFTEIQVRVDQGVVFLKGTATEPQYKEWAGRLANNTQEVVAVVNRITVAQRSMWDLSESMDSLRQLTAQAVRSSPMIALGLIVLVLGWVLAMWSAHASSFLFQGRFKSKLLADVAARAVAVPVFLLGLYLVLRISGLTRLAATVIGGTGLLGLIIGFAFRDIAENFLASLLISMQHPFATNDFIKVAGHTGFVQSVNTRSTLLMTLEGNHVQIPNATIYKEIIINYTANPHEQFNFMIGIGYDESIAAAQSVALGVLSEHPAVMDEPEQLVLVEELGAATVKLKIYFWVNIKQYSGIKVRSAVIRQMKKAFEDAGIEMPDEAREVIFPKGVPVTMTGEKNLPPQRAPGKKSSGQDKTPNHNAEGDLASEAGDIEEQAVKSRKPEGNGENLLGP